VLESGDRRLRGTLALLGIAAVAGTAIGLGPRLPDASALPRLLTLVWVVTLAATALPSTAPTLIAFRSASPSRPDAGSRGNAEVGSFLLGFALACLAIGAALGLLHARLAGLVPAGAGAVGAWLVAVGARELSPVARAERRAPPLPLHVFLARWRRDRKRAFAMGAGHAGSRLARSALLLLLLFAGGLLGLPWMAGLAALGLLAWLVSEAAWPGRALGWMLIGAGAALLLRPLITD
jgi:predicted metal-binding membrane protein